ncbi:MAG: VOC family protein [Gammaproteobacteria bacterium]|nr:VOC family protein [Gammaproteobacteria bacterium]
MPHDETVGSSIDHLSINSSSPAPLVKAIDHCSLIVADTCKALEFYEGILGLRCDASRPELGYPGAWLLVGHGQIHLLEVPNPDSTDKRPAHGGRDHHVALQVSDLDELVNRLEAASITYRKSKSGRAALFCRDFDGNAIELVEK